MPQSKNDQKERKAKGRPRRQNQRFDEAREEGLGAASDESQADGDDKNSTSDSDSQREDSRISRTTGRTISGGILRQLREEVEIQLAHHKTEIERLEKRKRELDELTDELTQKEARPFPSEQDSKDAEPLDEGEEEGSDLAADDEEEE
ncbi:MAG: hypothetical protein Fur006_69550 [Coleofasciculaceae cyanobacterium]